jgi:soluble lytic murein transglycosylase-like protein
MYAKKGLAGFLFLAAASCLIAASAADLRKLYDPVVKKAAGKHRIDAALIHVIIKAESNYDVFAISDKGAMGLMQLMPATARQYGVNNVFDPSQNIEGGVRYLKDLVKLYDGQTRLVLAAYNAGQEAVKKYKGIPPYAETKAYIAGIMKNYKKPSVRTASPTYMVKDAAGRTVLVNDPAEVAKKGG